MIKTTKQTVNMQGMLPDQEQNLAMDLLLPNTVLEENKDLTVEQLARLTGYHEKLIRLRLQ